MGIVVTDLETSDLDPARGSILSIGAVRRGGSKFYGRCRPWEGARIDPKALEVNGFSEEEIREESWSEAALVGQFLAWLGGPVLLAGMNIGKFDVPFLAAALARVGASSRWLSHRSLDLHTLAVAFAVKRGLPVPDRGIRTDQIYVMLGMPEEPRPHDALRGARWEAEAFVRLLED